jgi:hypothetical protein
MYASLRTYRIGLGSVDAVMRRVDRDFAEALSQERGFVAYHAIDTGNDMVMTISLFHDREQAQASNELAAQWVAEELSDFNVTRVGVIGGVAMVSRAAAEILGPATPDPRRFAVSRSAGARAGRAEHADRPVLRHLFACIEHRTSRSSRCRSSRRLLRKAPKMGYGGKGGRRSHR